jgi:GT2 family glycosyltransferase
VTITVLVPTYRRPDNLKRCLEALRWQIRVPDEVLVVVRSSDAETRSLLSGFDRGSLPLRVVKATNPGVIAAMSAGLEVAQGDVIAITDDDAVPHSDWLTRIEAYFSTYPELAGVGGRDLIYHGEHLEDGAREVVGKVQWFGRVIGNHHLGIGKPREVDELKGVNCAYRRAVLQRIGFDGRLRGTGAQVHWELSLDLRLKSMGWKLIYDPAIVVDHYVGPRFGEDQRYSVNFDTKAMIDAVHNETLVLLEHLPPLQRVLFVVWATVIGTRAAPGLVQWLRFLPREGTLAGKKLRAALKGRFEGWRTWAAHGGSWLKVWVEPPMAALE